MDEQSQGGVCISCGAEGIALNEEKKCPNCEGGEKPAEGGAEGGSEESAS